MAMFFQVLLMVLFFQRSSASIIFVHIFGIHFDKWARSLGARFALTWAGKWSKLKMFTTLASKFDFEVFLHVSNPSLLVLWLQPGLPSWAHRPR